MLAASRPPRHHCPSFQRGIVQGAATSHTCRWALELSSWAVLSVRNPHQFSQTEWEKRNAKYLTRFFCLFEWPCFAVHGILVPRPRMEPRLPAWEKAVS